MRTRSTETLPFHLILATVLVSGQWFLYGMAIHNPFVQVILLSLPLDPQTK